jgi:hypothetical protein
MQGSKNAIHFQADSGQRADSSIFFMVEIGWHRACLLIISTMFLTAALLHVSKSRINTEVNRGCLLPNGHDLRELIMLYRSSSTSIPPRWGATRSHTGLQSMASIEAHAGYCGNIWRTAASSTQLDRGSRPCHPQQLRRRACRRSSVLERRPSSPTIAPT